MSEDSDSESSSSNSDEELPKINEEFEKSFLKALSSLKNNDPSIYDKEKHFFDETSTVLPVSAKKKNKDPKEKPLFLKDYERVCLTENGGYDYDENDEDNCKSGVLPYAVEQRKLKESFKTFLKDSDDEDEGNLLKPSLKSDQQVQEEEADYVQWLKGQKEELEDKATEENLRNLRDFWNSDNLGEDEAFLRDYILNRKFMDKDDSVDDDSELSEDSETFEAQESFEQEYNLRYETGDNLIRRFPRNVEDSLRRRDNKRSKKRAEIKERKELGKKKKREEINRQKKLKVKEIAERLEKLKELTGNEKLAFNDDDILNDFDPAEHDKKMSEMYNDEFYNEQDGDKPHFDNSDLEGNYDKVGDDEQYNANEEEFSTKKDKKKTRTKRKKERKKAFSDISSIEKPIYDPKLHNSYQKYMDEYYQLDCEDFIDDLPCRFKYKQVEPNDYGLSVEEILTADDKELNQWSSIKKIYKIRASHVEKNEAKMYKLKGQNDFLKQKILPSLYKTDEDNHNAEASITYKEQNTENPDKISKNKKKKKTKKNKTPFNQTPADDMEMQVDNEIVPEEQSKLNDIPTVSNPINSNTNKKSNKRKRNESATESHSEYELLKESNQSDCNVETNSIRNIVPNQHMKSSKHYNKFKKYQKGNKFNKNHNFHDSRLSAYGLNPKKFKIKS